MMQFKKPKNAKWSDNTGVEITIIPNYGTADFMRTISEDAMIHAEPGSLAFEDAREVLRQLYENDLIDCDHSYTEEIAVDDTRWMEPDGPHARSNPDQTQCLICGKIYNPEEEEWQEP